MANRTNIKRISTTGFLVFSIVMVLATISCSRNNYKIESALYSCLLQTYDEQGINLKTVVKEVEEAAFEQGILNGSSGNDYLEYYKTIVIQNEIPSFTIPENMECLVSIHPFEFYDSSCLINNVNFDSAKIANSKLFKLHNNFNSISNISPSEVASIISGTLSEKDFNNEYYKTLSILILLWTSDIDYGIYRKLPPPNNILANIDSSYAQLAILVRSDDKIFLNDKECPTSKLKEKIKFFINENNPDYLISLRNERSTSYETYIIAQNKITEAINEIRDNYSIEKFNKLYRDLDEDEQKIVQNEYPIKIAEAEPK